MFQKSIGARLRVVGHPIWDRPHESSSCESAVATAPPMFSHQRCRTQLGSIDACWTTISCFWSCLRPNLQLKMRAVLNHFSADCKSPCLKAEAVSSFIVQMGWLFTLNPFVRTESLLMDIDGGLPSPSYGDHHIFDHFQWQRPGHILK